MQNERHYPQVFKFAMLGLLAFDVFIFYNATINIKAYCVIMFFVILNGWASSEDENFEYCDLYLLIDAFCFALYLVILLELHDGSNTNFWLISCIIFVTYWVWNRLLSKQAYFLRQEPRSLHVYNVCNIAAAVYSLAAHFIISFINNIDFLNITQITGMVLWMGLLSKWYYDFYIKTFYSR